MAAHDRIAHVEDGAETAVHLDQPAHDRGIIGTDGERLEQRDRRILPSAQVAEDRRDVDVPSRVVRVETAGLLVHLERAIESLEADVRQGQVGFTAW